MGHVIRITVDFPGLLLLQRRDRLCLFSGAPGVICPVNAIDRIKWFSNIILSQYTKGLMPKISIGNLQTDKLGIPNVVELFSVNTAKTLVFDVLVWWRQPRHCLFPIYRARAVYEHWTLFSVHTQNGKLADCEEIFSELDKKCIGLES